MFPVSGLSAFPVRYGRDVDGSIRTTLPPVRRFVVDVSPRIFDVPVVFDVDVNVAADDDAVLPTDDGATVLVVADVERCQVGVSVVDDGREADSAGRADGRKDQSTAAILVHPEQFLKTEALALRYYRTHRCLRFSG